MEALHLTTAPPRAHITIDGDRYELRHPQEFSLGQGRRIEIAIEQFDSAMAAASSVPDDLEDAMAESLRTLAGLVLDAPGAVVEALRQTQQLAILYVWRRQWRSAVIHDAHGDAERPPATRLAASPSP